jgi:glycosyltransferase involved in cell wall biosynthesis
MQLPATTALIKALDKWQIKTVAVHHDFWFERSFFKKPKYFFIKEILNSLPPSRPYIVTHQVINSLAEKELLRRRGIEAEVIGDYFDFEKPVAKIDNFNKDLRKYFNIRDDDILVLHATRITPRKNIENALIFSRELEKNLRRQAPINILGRNFKKDSKVIVFLPNFVESDDLDYYKNLKRLGEKLRVNVIFAWEHFSLKGMQENGIKIYSFWDAYLFADLVTYTSSLEGFGNQFLEAIHFKKIPVVFEYPVFSSDIKKEGYQYISLGNKLQKRNGFLLVPKNNIETAVDKTIKLFKNQSLISQIVEANFLIAKKNHSLENLEENLKKIKDKI